MQYSVYCLLKNNDGGGSDDKVLRVKVIADCISEALKKAKSLFSQKLRSRPFNIFMYETAE